METQGETQDAKGDGVVAEMGSGTRIGTGIETRTGSRKVEERRKSARNRTRIVDAIRHFSSARVTISADRGGRLRAPGQLYPQGLVPVHAHRTEGVTGSEGREGVNGVGSGIGVGVGTEMGTGTGMERERERERGWRRTKDCRVGTGTGAGTRRERGRGWRPVDEHTMGTRTAAETETRACGDGNRDEDGNRNGNEDRIGEGGGNAKKRKKPHKSCRRHVGNGGDLGGKRKKSRKERVGLVAASPDKLENNKETGGGT